MSCENCFCPGCEKARAVNEEQKHLIHVMSKWNWNYTPLKRANAIVESDIRPSSWYATMERFGYNPNEIGNLADLVEEIKR